MQTETVKTKPYLTMEKLPRENYNLLVKTLGIEVKSHPSGTRVSLSAHNTNQCCSPKHTDAKKRFTILDGLRDHES